ncbi:MAG: C40 family peptidase [Clostridia bacterium]|nr:C40 family peptidase [Clostridia bacterium]
MKTTKKIKILFTLMLVLIALFICNVAKADTNNEEDEVYESLLTQNAEEEQPSGNVTYPSGVTRNMTKSTYWSNKASEPNKVLMTKDEIKALNSEIIGAEGTNVVDLESIESTVNAGADAFYRNGALRQLYINGEPIDQQAYLDKFEEGNGSLQGVIYAVAVKRANMKCWPTNELVGYSPTDADDETQLDALNVNDPVVIRDICVVDGETFYYCQSKTCFGWVDANNLATFDNKDEWAECWKYDVDDTDILVVKESKITLEPSARVPETSEVQLMLGTILKLVPENEIPRNIGERGTWFNYVVYLPTRDENGKCVMQYALISEKYNVSVGFSDLTQSNILDVAFTCLGDRYGWGSMLGSYDCSAYTKAIYKCFGLDIPRNTTWQQKIPGRFTDISSMTVEEKQNYFKTIPAGSLVYFPGHAMMYIGSEDDMGYVISDTGSLSDSEGELDVRSMYTVILNPLSTRRGNGNTWVHQLTGVITFGEIEQTNEEVQNPSDEVPQDEPGEDEQQDGQEDGQRGVQQNDENEPTGDGQQSEENQNSEDEPESSEEEIIQNNVQENQNTENENSEIKSNVENAKKTNSKATSKKSTTRSPKAGDIGIGIWVGLSGIAVIAIIVIVVIKNKRNKEN